jgi:hypothetical protein
MAAASATTNQQQQQQHVREKQVFIAFKKKE